MRISPTHQRAVVNLHGKHIIVVVVVLRKPQTPVRRGVWYLERILSSKEVLAGCHRALADVAVPLQIRRVCSRAVRPQTH